MNAASSGIDNYYTTLKVLSPYLGYLFQLNEVEEEDHILSHTPLLKGLQKNVQQNILNLSSGLKASPHQLHEANDFLNKALATYDPIKYFKTHKVPPLLAKIKNTPDFLELAENVKENKATAKKWMKLANGLTSFDEVLNVLSTLDIPVLNLIVGVVKNPVAILIRGTQLWAKRYDPSVVGPASILQGATFLSAVGVITSTIGLTSLALGGAATGVALAPICLFIYGVVGTIDKLVNAFVSIYDFYKTFREKEPPNTYALRVRQKAINIVYTFAKASFDILLTALAFTAIANPLGLAVATTVTFFGGIGMAVLGSITVWRRRKLGKKIRAIEEEKASIQEKSEDNTKKIKNKPIPKARREILNEYAVSRIPITHILFEKENIKVSDLKKQLKSEGKSEGIFVDLIPNTSKDHFKIIKETFDGQKKIALVSQHENHWKYDLIPSPPPTKGSPKKISTQERIAELKTILKSISINQPNSLVLQGGKAKEVLLIYKIAIDLGMKNIKIAKTTEARIAKTYPKIYAILSARHKALNQDMTLKKTSPKSPLPPSPPKPSPYAE